MLFEQRGDVAVLEAGLAALRTRSLVRSFWRSVPLLVAAASLGSIFPIAAHGELFSGQVLVQIGIVVPLLLGRAWIPPLDRRRIDVARGLLRALAAGPAAVRLDLGSTERPDLRDASDPDAVHPPEGVLRSVYVSPWLRFQAPIAGGGSLRFERRERVQIDCPTPERRKSSRSTHGATDVRVWSWIDETDVDLGEGSYREAATAAPDGLASRLGLPEGTAIESLEVRDHRVRLVVRSLFLTQKKPDTIRDAASAIDYVSQLRALIGRRED